MQRIYQLFICKYMENDNKYGMLTICLSNANYNGKTKTCGKQSIKYVPLFVVLVYILIKVAAGARQCQKLI